MERAGRRYGGERELGSSRWDQSSSDLPGPESCIQPHALIWPSLSDLEWPHIQVAPLQCYFPYLGNKGLRLGRLRSQLWVPRVCCASWHPYLAPWQLHAPSHSTLGDKCQSTLCTLQAIAKVSTDLTDTKLSVQSKKKHFWDTHCRSNPFILDWVKFVWRFKELFLPPEQRQKKTRPILLLILLALSKCDSIYIWFISIGDENIAHTLSHCAV